MTKRLLIPLIWLLFASIGFAANPCAVPDNGTGTVDLPANCDIETAPGDPFMIIDGLPPGTTIEMPGFFDTFICPPTSPCSSPLPPGICEQPGGALGGHLECFEASLDLTISGTGSLAGFNRHLNVPVFLEIHTGPRIPGDPVQTFSADIYRLQGELFGDPDFCTFRVYGGSDYGLPSPGEITLTDLGDGTFNVESFFDITYQIEFEGCPASQLEDYVGTTTATLRLEQGTIAPVDFWEEGGAHKMHWPQMPDEDGWNVNASAGYELADDWECSANGSIDYIIFWGSWLNGSVGTINSFTVNIYADIPDPTPQDPTTFSMPGDVLWSREFSFGNVVWKNITPDPVLWEGWYDPLLDQFTYPDHDNYFQYELRDIIQPFEQQIGTIYWLGIKAHVDSDQPVKLWGWKSTEEHYNDDAAYGTSLCTELDNGSGTIDLPADCDFVPPDDVYEIINGLPPGTTIELDGPITDFTCTHQFGLCTSPLPQGQCEGAGGSLGGDLHCFEATLDVDVTGTGSLAGFNRHLSIPINNIEVHTAPRIPGDPVQSMAADLYRLQGELFGDPDFCTFRITAGTDFGLPSPGQIDLYQHDPDWWIESFFDVTYQIEFEGCPGSQLDGYAGTTTATIRITQGDINWQEMFEPQAADPITNSFFVQLDQQGMVIDGAGENAFGDGWYFYPNEMWWNIWFYDHPFTYDNYKDITIDFDIFATSPQSFAEIAINWSTDAWSLDQPPLDSAPPLPGANENLYIGREIVLSQPMPEGHFNFQFTIPDYNPEWVSIDVRGVDFLIPGGVILHECIPHDRQSLDLAFVISQMLGDCDCDVGNANGDLTKNILDITYLIAFLYSSGPPPTPYAICSGDANCDCQVNILDITYLIGFLYQGFLPPCSCEDWLNACGPPLRK